MNNNLVQLLKIYTTQSHKDVSSFLIEQSKDNIIAMFLDLLTTYINDTNSSTIREFITVNVAGYEHSMKKIGYNGYKHSTAISGTPIQCEAKPKNFNTVEYIRYQNKERLNPPSKLNGGGNFTDYTLKRFEKDKNANLNMLISGFVDGSLIYIFEFAFNTQSFLDKLDKQLKKHFKDGDKKNKYLRGASFDYKDFINAENLKIIYLLPKNELVKHQNYIVRDFYKWMITKTQ